MIFLSFFINYVAMSTFCLRVKSFNEDRNHHQYTIGTALTQCDSNAPFPFYFFEPTIVSACSVPTQNPKKCYSTCHIECLRPVHGALNVDEKKLIA